MLADANRKGRVTMATKIILTVEDGLTDQEIDGLQLLFSDVFSEFAARRYPAEQYIEERYPSANHGYDWLNRPEKIEQVKQRIGLAQKLHKATFGHVLDPEPREAKRAYDATQWLRDTFGMEAEEARATYEQLTGAKS